MKTLIICVLFFPSILFAQCEFSFKTENLCSEIKWLTGPFVGKPSSFELKFFDSTDKNKSAKKPKNEVNIYTWMKMNNGHDHGGPGLVINEKKNIWTVEKARFFGGMSGSWWVRVELKESNKVLEMIEFPVKL